MPSFDELTAHIDQPGIDSDPSQDIALLKPDITQDEALAIQFAVKRRRVAAGDRIVGHQASFTSAGIRKMFPDAPRPMVGTLLGSIVRADGDGVLLDCESAFIESEIALLLKHDLEGPNLTINDVLAATEALLPAIEVAPLRPGVFDGKYSWPHLIAVQKAFGGYVVFGSQLILPHSVDLRTEGVLVSIDGEAKAAATGFEAMGSPLAVVAAMAAKLHAIGEMLRAGQLIMTGSLAEPQVITPQNRVARLDFRTLGGVSVRIASE